MRVIAPTMPLATRLQFADLCMARGIRRAVEVGTDRGLFAEAFLDRWKTAEILVCVDPWEPYDHMPFDRTPDLMMATVRLARFGSRVRLLRMRSSDAAHYVAGSPYHSPGFVYLDGDHGYDAVRSDLAAWWPVVVAGGILAGHDYTDEAPGVLHAVAEFTTAHQLELQVTADYEETRSWWLEKR